VKGKSRVVKMNYGGGSDYEKIRRQQDQSIKKGRDHFQKVNFYFSLVGMFVALGGYISSFFGNLFGERSRTDTSEGTTAADSRRGGIVTQSYTKVSHANRYTRYYKMNIPKSARAGLSFEELQLVKKALYPRFSKDGTQMVGKNISLAEMMEIRVKVVGF